MRFLGWDCGVLEHVEKGPNKPRKCFFGVWKGTINFWKVKMPLVGLEPTR